MALYLGKDLISNNAITSDTLPIGTMVDYGGNTAPQGWMVCDGSAISRIAFSELFEAIGITYGGGDGETTFNIPDFRGKVGIGIIKVKQQFPDRFSQMPPGSIINYGGIEPPMGWLLCDGSEISRAGNSALFNAIGINYGEGNGVTTFNLPEFSDIEQKNLLWENSNPSVAFTTLTINLDLSKYDKVEIWCRSFYSSVDMENPFIAKVGESCRMLGMSNFNSSDGQIYQRKAEITNTGIIFQNSMVNSGSSPTTNSNNALIPYRIYGISKIGGANSKYIIKANNNITDEVQDPTVLSRLAAIETNNMKRYSTDEIVVGEWINGKPIYRRVYQWTSTLGQNYQVDTDVYNKYNIEYIIKLNPIASGLKSDNTHGYAMAGGDYQNSSTDKIDSYISPSGVLYCRNGSSYPHACICFLIMEYTKITDTVEVI